MLFIVYLIVFKFYNKQVRGNLRKNANTTTSILNMDELGKPNCAEKKIYCVNNDDCLQLCSHAIDDELQTQYKCNEINTCTQSILNSDDEQTPIVCKKDYDFYPVLTADEIFQPRWTCLNTKPYLFNDKQEFHHYICAGGDQSKLDPKAIFESCVCGQGKIKVRDEFREFIPVCIEKNQLSLFPNLIPVATTTTTTTTTL